MVLLQGLRGSRVIDSHMELAEPISRKVIVVYLCVLYWDLRRSELLTSNPTMANMTANSKTDSLRLSPQVPCHIGDLSKDPTVWRAKCHSAHNFLQHGDNNSMVINFCSSSTVWLRALILFLQLLRMLEACFYLASFNTFSMEKLANTSDIMVLLKRKPSGSESRSRKSQCCLVVQSLLSGILGSLYTNPQRICFINEDNTRYANSSPKVSDSIAMSRPSEVRSLSMTVSRKVSSCRIHNLIKLNLFYVHCISGKPALSFH